MTDTAVADAPQDTKAAATTPPVQPPATAASVLPSASDKAEPPKQAQAPEKYTLKMPKESLLEASALERIEAEARKRGLSNEDAQALLDRDHSTVNGFMESRKTAMAGIVKEWQEEWHSDKELGGDRFKESTEGARRVLEKFATPKLLEELRATGFGNYPEFGRFLYNIYKAAGGADKLILPGVQASQEPKAPWELLYEKSLPKKEQ